MDELLLIKLRVERLREIQIELEVPGCDEAIQVIEDLITRLMRRYWRLVTEE